MRKEENKKRQFLADLVRDSLVDIYLEHSTPMLSSETSAIV